MLCAGKIRYLASNVKIQSFIADIMSKDELSHSYGLLAYKTNKTFCGLNLKLCHQATHNNNGKTRDRR